MNKLGLRRITAPFTKISALALATNLVPLNAIAGVSGEVSLVSDYRFRGASVSGGEPAIQAGAQWTDEQGWYVGAWASTLGSNGNAGTVELDAYAGWSTAISGSATFDVNIMYYHFPAPEYGRAAEWDSFEANASVSTKLDEKTDVTAGVSYVWPQPALGDVENWYTYVDVNRSVSERMTIFAHAGFTDGAYSVSNDGDNFDWSMGASYEVADTVSVSAEYVGIDVPEPAGFERDALVFAIERTW